MNRKYLLTRAVRGPLLLILLGLLFLVDQHGRLPVSRSWPILLIAYGFLKLAERLLAPSVPELPYPPPPFSSAPQYPSPTPSQWPAPGQEGKHS